MHRNSGTRLPVRVLSRAPVEYKGTYGREVVTCRLNGREIGLFCKYDPGEAVRVKAGHACRGHRGGVGLEARVYRDLLEPLGMPHARFFGAYREAGTGQTWLFLEYLESGHPLTESLEWEAAMLRAARWIGRFHKAAASRTSVLGSARRYDEGYYLGWMERTLRFAGPHQRRFPWLRTVCERFESVASELAAMPRTVIHGEYYPHHLLLRGGQVHPVDWESAAVAPGQIDLAAQTDGWPDPLVRRCEAAYRRARWPEGGPPDFRRGVDAARLYLSFRWLGDRPEWTQDPDARANFKQIQVSATRLGLL